jgi:hypothetical protein
VKSTHGCKGSIRALTGLALVVALGAISSSAAAQTPPPEGPPPGFSPAPGAAPISPPPPAPGGMPPGYGYGVPGQGYGQVMGPKELDYEEGDPVPAGYHLKSKRSKGMIAGGAATFGALWLFSVVAAPIANATRSLGDVLSCTSGGGTISTQNGVSSTNNCNNTQDNYDPLYIPVAGPFITMGTAHAKGAGIALLAIDGVGQAAGLALLILGIVKTNEKLVRNDVDKVKVMPVIGANSAGIMGTF